MIVGEVLNIDGVPHKVEGCGDDWIVYRYEMLEAELKTFDNNEDLRDWVLDHLEVSGCVFSA